MPQDTKHTSPADAHGAVSAAPSLAGWTVDLADEAMALDVLDKAFDYRGDVTLHLAPDVSGTVRVVTGYLFDRQRAPAPAGSPGGLAGSFVRLLTPAGDEKISIPYGDIRRVEFSAKDPAHGKSFETWVKKYVEKKLKGERASIDSEGLE